MNKTDRLEIMKNCLSKLEGSPKNIKCGGVVRALQREIRNLTKEISCNN